MANKHYTPEEDKILLREMNNPDTMISMDEKVLSACNEIYAKLFIKRSTNSVMARYRQLTKGIFDKVISDNNKPVFHSDPVKQAEAEEIIRRTNLPKEEREKLPEFKHHFFGKSTEFLKSNLTDAQRDFQKLLSESEEERSAIDRDKYEKYLESLREKDLFLNPNLRSENIYPGFIREINEASKRKLRLMRTMIDHYLGE